MTRDSKLVAAFLAAASVTVLLSASLVTLGLADGAPSQWRLPFRLICHGIEQRAFIIAGAAMPICARCTAIWSGLLLGAATFALLGRGIRQVPFGAMLILVIPMAADGITQALGLRESTNLLRAMTGLVAGTAFAIWALGTIEKNAYEKLNRLKIESVTPR